MSLFLRDINYTPFAVTIGANVTKGDTVLQNDVYSFYLQDQDITERTEVTTVIKAQQVLAGKATGTGETISKGDWVYLDPATALVSATKAGAYVAWVGTALENASASDSDVLISFNGTDPNRA